MRFTEIILSILAFCTSAAVHWTVTRQSHALRLAVLEPSRALVSSNVSNEGVMQ
jgi:hypothetical protein